MGNHVMGSKNIVVIWAKPRQKSVRNGCRECEGMLSQLQLTRGIHEQRKQRKQLDG